MINKLRFALGSWHLGWGVSHPIPVEVRVSAKIHYAWNRLTAPVGVAPERDVHGWVTTDLPWQHREVKPLSARRDVPVVVLLGERGFGKSDAIRHEHDDLSAAGVRSGLLDLATLPSNKIEPELQALLEAARDQIVYAHLDGLDDAARTAEVDKLLIYSLGQLDQDVRAWLRLRISCRTAPWPEQLDALLTRVWAQGVERVHLAGLTRSDALLAATTRGVADPGGFVEQVEHRRLVVPLALWPVTFLPLLEDAAQGRPLPQTVSAAYASACRQLCLEKDPGVLGAPRGPAREARELIVLARRAAAALQFCGRGAVSVAAGEPDTVGLDELVQGEETLDGGGQVLCSEAGYRELTESGLLAPTQSMERWVFSHRSFQEYLAADYLRVHQVSAPVRRALLLVGDGPSLRAATDQRETAAWLAMSDDTLFKDLCKNDPQTLLLADLAVRSAQDRAGVLDALARHIRRGAPLEVDRTLLYQLDSDLLPGRLVPLLQSGAPEAVLHLALSVAQACPHPQLADDLIQIAEETSVHGDLRAMAMVALADCQPSQDSQRVRIAALADDADPDVAAHAITQLWPEHLTTAEMLAKLPAPEPHRPGQAAALLQRLPRMLTSPGDWTAATEWAAATLTAASSDSAPNERTLLAVRLAADAVAAPSTPANSQAPLVLALAATMTPISRLGQNHRVDLELGQLAQALEDNAPVRRAVARAVLATASAPEITELCSAFPVPLFYASWDSAYWATELPTLPPDQQLLLEGPIAPRPRTEDEYWEVFEARQSNPLVAQFTAHWYQRSVQDPARDAFYAQRTRSTEAAAAREARQYDPAALEAAIEQLHTSGDARSAWRDVLGHLQRSTGEDHVSTPTLLDPAAWPSLPAPGTDLRTQLVRAAVVVPGAAPAITIDDIDAHGISEWNTAPELYALALLAALGQPLPDLDRNRWAGLAIGLLCAYPDAPNRMRPRNELLVSCAQRSNGGFDDLLAPALDRLGSTRRIHTMALLPPGLTAGSRQALLAWAQSPGRDLQEEMAALRYLAGQQDPAALDHLRNLINVAPSRLHGGVIRLPVARWTNAACILLQTGDSAAWARVLTTLDTQPGLSAPLVKELVHATAFGAGLAGTQEVSAKDLARLYTTLASTSPAAAAPGTPTPGSNLADESVKRGLRQTLLYTITTRDPADVLTAVGDLARRYPDDAEVDAAHRAVQREILDRTCTALTSVDDLVKVASSATARLANNVFQLRDIVLESLKRLQKQLLADNSWATALWNQDHLREQDQDGNIKSRAIWWPTWENDFSDFVASFLRYDLAGSKVIINREVELVRPGLGGSRTDIQIEAYPIGKPSGSEALMVVIESKGCWNRGLPTELTNQLVEKYLKRPGSRAGIYLIAYFDCSAWEPNKMGSRRHADHSIPEIRTQQRALARRAQREKVTVSAYVLDCRLPGSRVKEPITP